MSVLARYAVYFMPRPGSALLNQAANWLGRDAMLNQPLERTPVAGIESLDLDRLTAAPRHYGFHATLKAPFEPAKNQRTATIVDAVQAFARQQQCFSIQLEVAALGAFLALRPATPSPRMNYLHWACVQELDDLRAPISAADIERRGTGLTPEEAENLRTWGYPYIFERFRFHMTLTGRIACSRSRDRVQSALTAHFAPSLEAPLSVDGVAVYGQPDRNTPFTVISWCPFADANPQNELSDVHFTD